MKAHEVAALYRELGRLDLQFWLDGGWAADALLGRQTRDHGDLDVVVRQEDVCRLRGHLQSRGFADIPRDDSRAWNFVLGHPDGRIVDVHVIVFDAEGNGIYRGYALRETDYHDVRALCEKFGMALPAEYEASPNVGRAGPGLDRFRPVRDCARAEG